MADRLLLESSTTDGYLLEDGTGVLLNERTGYPAVVMADNPAAYWRHGESSGTNANDEVGTADGTYINAPTLGATGALSGDTDTAVTFNGTDEYVTVPDSASLDLGDVLSIEAWFKRTSAADTAERMVIAKGAGAYALTFNVSSDHKLAFANDNTAVIVRQTGTISDTNWHHVVVTKNGATVALYVDGADQTGTVTNSTLGNTADALFIGREAAFSGVFWDGGLDEVALYSTVLTAARVTAHYDAGVGAGGSLARTASDSLTFSDSASRAATLARSVTDVFTTSDAATRLATLLRTTADSLIYSDSATRILALARSSPDSLTFSDTGSLTLSLSRSTDDTLTFSDTAARVATALRSATDALATSDTAAGLRLIIRSAVDALTTRDLAHRGNPYPTGVFGTSGLVAYWRLGESSGTTAADSAGTNHGTYTNGPTLGVAGALTESDTAVTFDGVNDYVSVPDAAALDRANGPFSIEAWIKRTATGVAYGILSKGTGAYYFRVRNDNFLNLLRSNQADIAISNVTLPADTNWHHVAVTYAGSNGAIAFYINGADRSTTGPWTSNFTDNTTALTIGADNGSEFLAGSVDEVAFYSTALTAATVLAHYRNAPLTAGGSSFVRSVTDSITTSDTATRLGTFVRSVADSITTSDVASAVKNGGQVVRTAIDSLTTSDAATRIGTFSRSVSGSLTFSDVADAVKNGGLQVRTAIDSLTFSDTATRIGTFSRSVAGSLTFSDTATRIKTAIRSATDSLGFSDTASRLKTAVRSAVDSLTTSDASTRLGTFVRSATDGLTTSDGASRIKTALRSAIDALTTSDAASRSTVIRRAASDALGFVDSVIRVIVSGTAAIVGIVSGSMRGIGTRVGMVGSASPSASTRDASPDIDDISDTSPTVRRR